MKRYRKSTEPWPCPARSTSPQHVEQCAFGLSGGLVPSSVPGIRNARSAVLCFHSDFKITAGMEHFVRGSESSGSLNMSAKAFTHKGRQVCVVLK